jgi:hypothetical protein
MEPRINCCMIQFTPTNPFPKLPSPMTMGACTIIVAFHTFAMGLITGHCSLSSHTLYCKTTKWKEKEREKERERREREGERARLLWGNSPIHARARSHQQNSHRNIWLTNCYLPINALFFQPTMQVTQLGRESLHAKIW